MVGKFRMNKYAKNENVMSKESEKFLDEEFGLRRKLNI